MKLWKISQTVNDDYDTYDSAVVAAEDYRAAKRIHPGSYKWVVDDKGNEGWGWVKLDGAKEVAFSIMRDWANKDDIKVEYIGEAAPNVETGVILASFNAG